MCTFPLEMYYEAQLVLCYPWKDVPELKNEIMINQ